jgi:hypothetical protein
VPQEGQRKRKNFWSELNISSECYIVAGKQGGGREIDECYSKTKENQSWGMLPGDQRRITSSQRLKQPMKWHVIMYGTSCTSPISVTCSEWYIRKAPLFSGLSLWTLVH